MKILFTSRRGRTIESSAPVRKILRANPSPDIESVSLRSIDLGMYIYNYIMLSIMGERERSHGCECACVPRTIYTASLNTRPHTRKYS